MDYLERLEKLDGFIKKCEGFNEEIIQSMFWNVNDDVILSESIDKKILIGECLRIMLIHIL